MESENDMIQEGKRMSNRTIIGWFLLYVALVFLCINPASIYNFFLPVLLLILILTGDISREMFRRIKIESHGAKPNITQLESAKELYRFCWSLKSFRLLLLLVAALIFLETVSLNTLASIIIKPHGDDEVLAIIPMLALFVFVVIINPLVLFIGGSIATKEIKKSFRIKLAMLLCALCITLSFLFIFDVFFPSHGVFVTIHFIYGLASLLLFSK